MRYVLPNGRTTGHLPQSLTFQKTELKGEEEKKKMTGMKSAFTPRNAVQRPQGSPEFDLFLILQMMPINFLDISAWSRPSLLPPPNLHLQSRSRNEIFHAQHRFTRNPCNSNNSTWLFLFSGVLPDPSCPSGSSLCNYIFFPCQRHLSILSSVADNGCPKMAPLVHSSHFEQSIVSISASEQDKILAAQS